jgi:hypothetical protein
MRRRLDKASDQLPMHLKVLLNEKIEKVVFAKGYTEITVSKDDTVFENEIDPFYRLMKNLAKELEEKKATIIFDDKRFSYLLLYQVRKIAELKEIDHEVIESYLNPQLW